MHEGWHREREAWMDRARVARTLRDAAEAAIGLEDWIALDYAPCSQARPLLPWHG